MPYIEKSPEHGNFSELTDVSGSFNASTSDFTQGAEALPDESGGSAEGRTWFKANRGKIAVERAKMS